MSFIMLASTNRRLYKENEACDKNTNAKETSSMNVLLHNVKEDRLEIQTVWRARVGKKSAWKFNPAKNYNNEDLENAPDSYGVEMDICYDEFSKVHSIFVPVGGKEEADKMMLKLYNEKQLDLTSYNVYSGDRKYQK